MGMADVMLGIDLGSRRIGVAVAAGRLATPIETLGRSTDQDDARRIATIARERGASRVVVGLPIRLDGTAGPAAESAHAFAGALRAEGIDVVLWDERLTTVEAERSLAAAGTRGRARRAVVDTVAASVILQSYLDAAR